MGMPKTAQKMHKETVQDLIDDEVEAVENYDRAIEGSDNPEAIATYEHIKGEEEEHIAELQGLDKMKAEDITSEQAWNDFKSGYSDFEEKHIDKARDGDNASMEEKIDVLSAKISEMNTDLSRLTDSVPQALGTIEEGKTLEDEAEEAEEGDELAGEEEGGDYLDDFFGGDDGLEDESAGGEEVVDENGEEVADGDGLEEFGDEDVAEDDEIEESDDGETIDEGEEVVEDDADDDSTADEGASDEDEDYISMDEIMDDSDGEEAESDEEEVEATDDKDEEKLIDKMVAVLEKMDMRITHLERENAGLKKQLADQKRMTVQTMPNNMAKSRPTQNATLKMVKGSYNRPPVSTQYVANQRDIGIGKKKESSNTSVFRQGLNEVFENCERIAHQTNY